MLALALMSPNPEIKLILFVASLVLALCAIVKYLTQRPEAAVLVDDDKQIILFNKAAVLDPYSVQCVHCGECFGLCVENCPRCKRSQNVLA
jgi:ferredoxin